jgi:predicted AAA+ superfamily ATPase
VVRGGVGPVFRRGGHDRAALPRRADECYFWATPGGAELDLLVVRGQRRYGFEFKYTTAPSVTQSMHSAREDLHLDRLDVVHAGEAVFPMREGIRAVALRSLQHTLEPL